ncbi:MAG TPA: nuclear transport factor 2 family protein [Candidatus Bathyarchaeia archaeon]|nr:nuclear transport factor 2 family protein [Candidatus Bathyarchaeia archaeon]
MPVTRLVVNKWIRNYSKAWLKKDAKAIASLFAEDAAYYSHPFRPVHQGSKSILDYTLGALDVGEVYDVRFGKPVVEATRAAVEYWATMKEKMNDVTLAGCVILHFAKNGLCKELHDYWILQTGRVQAPPNWGR